MPQFKFNTVSRADIERSPGGNTMIQAIDYDGPHHQLITGVPGSGKTTVTIMRAERLVNQEKTIKIFTYQNLLRTSLKNIAIDDLKNKIFGFYNWYFKIRRFGYLNPSDTANEMLEKMKAEPVIDEILIDEGQDFEERIFQSLLPKCEKMSVGADNAQKVHHRGIRANQIKQELEKNKATIQTRLEYNYRNTYEIYNFARYFMPDNERVNRKFSLKLMPKGTGNKPVVMQALSEEEKFNRLQVILEGAGDKNIAVLLYHQSEVNFYCDRIREMGLSCSAHHNKRQSGTEIENILITTYKSAKGLEFQVVIMPDMHTAMNSYEKTSEHYYIGCTRSKESLFLLFTGENLPSYFDDFDENSYEFNPSDGSTETKVEIESESDTNNDDLPF